MDITSIIGGGHFVSAYLKQSGMGSKVNLVGDEWWVILITNGWQHIRKLSTKQNEDEERRLNRGQDMIYIR